MGEKRNNALLLFIFFSGIAVTISTKLGTEHAWVMGIKVYSNEGPRPSKLGDDSKTPLLHNLCVNFNQAQNILARVMVIHKGPRLFQQDDSEITKIHGQHLKSFFIRTDGLISTMVKSIIM